MRVVLVADDLEGFSSDETAALKLAAFIGALRQSVERLDFILSINQDIWQSAFVPRLSGGLQDRLSEVVVELKPLTEDEMVALLESRVPGLGERVLSRVDLDSAGGHARGLIRAAGIAWLKASAMDSQRAASPVIEVPRPAARVALASSQEPAELVAPVIQATSPVPAPVANEPAPAVAVAQPVESFVAPVVEEAFERPQVDLAAPAPVLEAEPVLAAAVPVSGPPAVPVWNPPAEAALPQAGPLEPEGFVPAVPPPVEPAFADFSGPPGVPVQPELGMESDFSAVYPPPYSQAAPGSWSAPILDYSPVHTDTPVAQAGSDDSESFALPVTPEPAFDQNSPNLHESGPSAPPQAVPEPDVPPNPNADRVDDLLRQFRERYGRGSL
jgi:hypothetical protein